MIRADRLTKRFGPIAAVQDLSFEVPPGEILGFLGPNGAGKSTTLRILSGYWPPTSGRASIDGFDLVRASLAARRRLGYLPENFAAPPELRVQEYLRFRAGLKGLGRGRRARVEEVLEQLGLGPRRRQPVGALSKGFRQRLGLADALLAKPPALLLDEPLSGLDPLQRLEFRAFLREQARQGTAILFSSHVLPEVEDLADRVLVLHRGRMRALGPPGELATRLPGLERLALRPGARPAEARALLAADPGVATLEESEGEWILRLRPGTRPEELLQRLAAAGCAPAEFRRLRPRLEELFREALASGEEEA